MTTRRLLRALTFTGSLSCGSGLLAPEHLHASNDALEELAPVQELPAGAVREEGGGELCLACGTACEGEMVTLLHRGRRVHLHPGACTGAWETGKEALFARLQPKGALFDEAHTVPRALLSRWFFLGLYVLLALVCGGFASYVALTRGHPPRAAFFLGLLLNVIGVALIFLRGSGDLSRYPEGVPGGLRKVPLTRSPRACPGCGAGNHPSAAACSTCGAALQPTARSEVSGAG